MTGWLGKIHRKCERFWSKWRSRILTCLSTSPNFFQRLRHSTFHDVTHNLQNCWSRTLNLSRDSGWHWHQHFWRCHFFGGWPWVTLCPWPWQHWGGGLRFFHLWSCWSCWAPVMWLRERAWFLAELASSPHHWKQRSTNCVNTGNMEITCIAPDPGTRFLEFLQFLSFKNGLEEENDAHWHCCQPGRSLDSWSSLMGFNWCRSDVFATWVVVSPKTSEFWGVSAELPGFPSCGDSEASLLKTSYSDKSEAFPVLLCGDLMRSDLELPVTRSCSSKMCFFCWMIFLFKFLGLKTSFQHDFVYNCKLQPATSEVLHFWGRVCIVQGRIQQVQGCSNRKSSLVQGFHFMLSYWTWNRPRWRPNGSSRHRPGCGLMSFWGGTVSGVALWQVLFFWRRGIRIKSTNCWMWSSCTSIYSSINPKVRLLWRTRSTTRKLSRGLAWRVWRNNRKMLR